MTGLEIFISKFIIPILKILWIWWFFQILNRAKLCRLMSAIAKDYADAPKKTEEMCATLIVLFRYPGIRNQKNINITVQNKKIREREIDELRTLHEKCTDMFTAEQNRVIGVVLELSSGINSALKQIDIEVLDRESREKQKNIALQILRDWCYVLFMLIKIGKNRAKFKALNRDAEDFGSVTRSRFGVTIDQNELFELGLSMYGHQLIDSDQAEKI